MSAIVHKQTLTLDAVSWTTVSPPYDFNDSGNSITVDNGGTFAVQATVTAGPTDSFTALTEATIAGGLRLSGAYKILSATATEQTSWTISASATWYAAIAGLKAAGGAGTVIKDPIMRGVIARPR